MHEDLEEEALALLYEQQGAATILISWRDFILEEGACIFIDCFLPGESF
jgi:hypothetical protein